VNRTLISRGAVNFLKRDDARGKSPLAEKLLEVPGLSAVMIGRDFVTVTKADDGDWDLVHKTTSQTIESHLGANLPVFDPSFAEAASNGTASGGTEIEQQIKKILDDEIRPAVAMDGGDITFDRFEAGVVYLHMQGSCAGCPSSTATLKGGIETRLKEMIPEVIEVVAV
jgi:Fe-S cluster biogenesis protein NfuA